MIVDGKLIARRLQHVLGERFRTLDKKLGIALLVPLETAEVRRFVDLKVHFAQEVSVQADVVHMPQMSVDTEAVSRLLIDATRTYDGVVLQLPYHQCV